MGYAWFESEVQRLVDNHDSRQSGASHTAYLLSGVKAWGRADRGPTFGLRQTSFEVAKYQTNQNQKQMCDPN